MHIHRAHTMCIYMCVYIYIYIYIYIYLHIYIYIYIYVYMCMTSHVLHFSICACHPCASAMLIFSASFRI